MGRAKRGNALRPFFSLPKDFPASSVGREGSPLRKAMARRAEDQMKKGAAEAAAWMLKFLGIHAKPQTAQYPGRGGRPIPTQQPLDRGGRTVCGSTARAADPSRVGAENRSLDRPSGSRSGDARDVYPHRLHGRRRRSPHLASRSCPSRPYPSIERGSHPAPTDPFPPLLPADPRRDPPHTRPS